MLYRKRPIIVSANQWFPQPPPTPEAEDTPGKARKPELYGVRYCPPARIDASQGRGIKFDQPGRYVIDTLEGPMQVLPGDWIVTGVKGERYPVKPDIFALTYEIAEMQEAKDLGIEHIDRAAFWLRAAAVVVGIGLGVLWYLASHS